MILIKYKRKNDLKPYFYFALEEYISSNLLNKEQEVFFFMWQIHGIVIGKNQIIENEVNLDFLKKNNIPIFRRPTGGGCVYNDPQVPLFSIVVRKKDKNFNFKIYLQKIINSFKDLGVDLHFSGRNDILLNEKKVSGSAFMQTKHGMIMHGTLLYDCDVETMVRALNPNDEKLISKGIASVKSRITNLKNHIKNISQKQLHQFLEEKLTKKNYVLSSKQILEVELLSKKYMTKEWLYFQHPEYSKILKKRFSWGYLEILLVLKDGKIIKMNLAGDFFHKSDNLQLFVEKFEGSLYSLPFLEKILVKNDISEYILDASNKDFILLLKEGILEKLLDYNNEY
ncbi:lipoate--protein ligase [Candidatus Phytoplasma prunorum]|uniref:lipoate--protein ligase n=1 Tax=Candidatus Phytoplasma prunorum TaxID=47565 RepID=UPI002FF3CACE